MTSEDESREPEHPFILSDGREARIPEDIDRSALRDLLAMLPPGSHDSVLLALETPLPSDVLLGSTDSAFATRLQSNDPTIARIVARLYERRDAFTAELVRGRTTRRVPEPPILIAVVSEGTASRPSDLAVTILRLPESYPHDVVLLPDSMITPEQLNQAVREVLALRRSSGLEPVAAERHAMKLRASNKRIPSLWRGRLLRVLGEIQEAVVIDVPSVGRARSAVLDFRP